MLIARLLVNCPSANTLWSTVASLAGSFSPHSPTLDHCPVAVPHGSAETNSIFGRTTKLRLLIAASGERASALLCCWHTHTHLPNPFTSAPLPPPETLDIHKRPEGGDGPAKLGVITLPESQGVVAATDKNIRGDLATTMDGLAVEVRGSNGAFYKVTTRQTQF